MPKQLELILKSLKDYFSPSPYDDIVFFILILPAITCLIWLLIYKAPSSSNNSIPIPPKELEMYRIISFQKGLHDFDRKMLLELLLNQQFRPLYQVLIDKNAFSRLIAKIKEQKQENSNLITYLQNLENKIFLD